MPVDLLSGLRSANAQLIPVLQANAAAREREQQRRDLERQNRRANILALGGMAAGAGIAGPGARVAGAAAGATIGNMVGRASAGGPAPSVAEMANAGANLYGIYENTQQTAANAEINRAITAKAISELSSGVPQGMTLESAKESTNLARTRQELQSRETQAGDNVDEGLAAVPGPRVTAPTPEQQRTLESIQALQGLQSQNLGRINPQIVAAVTQSFLPQKKELMTVPGPARVYDPATGKIVLEAEKEGTAQTYEVRVGRGPNAKVLGTGVSLDDARGLAKKNEGSTIYKTSTEPGSTGEGTGPLARFNLYANQRVAQANEMRAKNGQPPLSAVESESLHSRVIDELNRQDMQRDVITIDPKTNLPGRVPGLRLEGIEKLAAGQGGAVTAVPITPTRQPVTERKQMTPEQYKGFTGTGTAMELMNVLNENVSGTGFIKGPFKEAAQRLGFMKPDGTLEFALAKARMDNIAQEIIKGIPSNFDVQTFQKTLAKVGEDPEANKRAIQHGTRQLARAMAEQLDYARRFNIDLPEQALQTAREFGVDVESILAGKGTQRIAFDKPLGIKLDPYVPANTKAAVSMAEEKQNKGRWMLWNRQLRQIQ